MAKKLTKTKAREILHDKSVHGQPLTDKQRRFFGAIAGGAKPYKAQNGIEGTMGGLTDKGFNFNPAWGGAWRNGGWLEKYTDGGNLQPPMSGAVQPAVPMGQRGVFLEPNSPKLPKVGPSSELAMSIGGENGEPAYLIPSMKYGRMQVNPMFEFMRTGEHLGGPFKTWQEADQWERDVRHPYVEKGQSIPTPYKRWGNFAMGGSLPGAVGFTYARTAGAAPSEGPYAKKTLPSAQNGAEMSFYQQGLDWKPKTISQDGSVIKDDMGYWNSMNWGKPVEIGSNQITMEGVNEPLVGISDTGDMQMMEPGKNYTFDGTSVVEYPMEYFQELGVARDGRSVNKADEYPLEKLDNLFNFTNYNKPKAKSGKWLDKYN